ncbi:prostate and testis expressed protein 4-like isoform X1 [Sphaerodactylus townsendi]|uniref:prostate and testis expressed protein 4-like isoform X1 n=1 Tax=Sphaerodactylus townsendi TaxID=933632 RepID=UPI00202709C4|nr:prostate and testis expressed protein 4-like isoform X1 [Sphaerodactylus townsendi]
MLKGSSLVRRRPSACLIGHILSCTWQQTPKMKRILVLVFSVLLCLAAVKSLMCNTCKKYEGDKCVEGEGICEFQNEIARCGTLFAPDNKVVWSFCAKPSGCAQFKKTKYKTPAPYLICCDWDLCNGPSPGAPPKETSPESDAASFPENL